jgi:hypothetical protein
MRANSTRSKSAKSTKEKKEKANISRLFFSFPLCSCSKKMVESTSIDTIKKIAMINEKLITK